MKMRLVTHIASLQAIKYSNEKRINTQALDMRLCQADLDQF